jgi:phage-related protein
VIAPAWVAHHSLRWPDDAVVMLGVFSKKSTATPKAVIDAASAG